MHCPVREASRFLISCAVDVTPALQRAAPTLRNGRCPKADAWPSKTRSA